MLLQNITDPKIAQAINTTKFFNNFSYGDIAFGQIGILKVLTDKKVIEKCNPDLIVEFMKNPNDMNLLNAYTQDLKKCFMSLKSENEISKINKRLQVRKTRRKWSLI